MKINILSSGKQITQDLKQALWAYSDSIREVNWSIAAFAKESAFLQDCRQTHPDTVFLSLDKTEKSILRLIQKLRLACPKTLVVLVGQKKEQAYFAYRVGAAYFLIPPFSWKELEHCQERCRQLHAAKPVDISFQINRTIVKIPLDRLIYIQVRRKQCSFYLDGQQEPFQINCSLQSVIKQLTDSRFLQIFRSYIVNMDYVKDFKTVTVLLFDGTELPCTKHSRGHLLRQYKNYTLSHTIYNSDIITSLIHYKERLQQAIKVSHTCIFEVELQKQRYTFFENAEAIFGVSDDVILSDVAAYAKLPPEQYRLAVSNYFSHPADSGVIAEAFKKILSGHSASYKARMKAGQSKFIWCHIDVQPIVRQGIPVRMIGVITKLSRSSWRRKNMETNPEKDSCHEGERRRHHEKRANWQERG